MRRKTDSLVRRLETRLYPDPDRVVVRPFNIAAEPRNLNPTNLPRAQRIVQRVADLGAAETAALYAAMIENFSARHRELEAVLDRRIAQLGSVLGCCGDLDLTGRRFVAAHFCHEYSFQSSALFNPSIIRHWDQSGLAEGDMRFILSLRSVGEGHISSITFATGVWKKNDDVACDPFSHIAQVAESNDAIGGSESDLTIVRPDNTPLNELVIFPMTASQRNGIEDLRLTEFRDGDRIEYYGTYTAYSGMSISSEILSTDDFLTFRMRPLTGPAAVNKGMALFPRRINGRYAMLSRIDNEHIFLALSDDILHWSESKRLIGPKYPWEFVQMGNCGAPLETPFGWLVLTHGVGAMRQYTLGACLLDLEDPSRVLARSAEPLMAPAGSEREGYVPNVLYTCGALCAGDRLLLPYGISDVMTGFAVGAVSDIIASMEPA